MVESYENQAPEKLQGKYQAIAVSCILGIGTLVSWNSLLTIGDYYYQVFPDYHPARVLTFIYQPFALGTIMVFSYYESKINTRKRNIFGYILFTTSTFLLIVLDLSTKGHGGLEPYIGVCAVVALFGIGDAVVRGGMTGDLSLMCPELIQSFTAGIGVAGALTSAFRLITKAAFAKSHDGLRKGAMIFLAISTFIQFLCVILYAYVFPKLPIVKYYRRKAASEGSKTVSADLAAVGIQNQSNLSDDDVQNQRLSNKELFLETKDYAVNLFLIFVLTMSILPGFLYENTGQHGLGEWYVLVLITVYSVWDLIGRYAPLVNWLKIENRKGLTIAVLSRYLLVPAFYFTVKYGDQGWMIMLISVFGFTNGHLNVCILTTAPKGYKVREYYSKISPFFAFVKGPEKNAVGNLMVLSILGGAMVGAALDWLWLIGKKNAF